MEVLPFRQYRVPRLEGSGRISLRSRVHLRPSQEESDSSSSTAEQLPTTESVTEIDEVPVFL